MLGHISYTSYRQDFCCHSCFMSRFKYLAVRLNWVTRPLQWQAPTVRCRTSIEAMTKDFTAIVHPAGRLLSSKAQNKFFVSQGVNAKDASLPIWLYLLNGAKDEDVTYTGKHVSQTFFTLWTGRRITAREIGFIILFPGFFGKQRNVSLCLKSGKIWLLTSVFSNSGSIVAPQCAVLLIPGKWFGQNAPVP